MLAELDAAQEVARLSGLRGYPKNPNGARELVRTLQQVARDRDAAREIIDSIRDTAVFCPTPAELRAHSIDRYSDEWQYQQRATCGSCIDGYTIEYFLCDLNGHRLTRSQRITRDQYDGLARHPERLRECNQMVNSGARHCPRCGHGG